MHKNMSNREIDIYIKKLANTEEKKSESYKHDSRHRISVHSGVLLNWLGDYFANPNIKWEKVSLSVKNILMTGVDPEWNKLFIKKCERKSEKLTKLIAKDLGLKGRIMKWVNSSKNPNIILVRKDKDKYKVLDGMHRFVKQILEGKEEIKVYAPTNEISELPHCEPHVVYDLIRGFQRNAYDKKGETQLRNALALLSRTYGNVNQLLKNRFNKDWISDKKVQKIIEAIIKS